ncbi:MAG: glutathione S-transferase family protein [Rhodovulum sulfidophilum]|uniref:Glutathione S-transferase family protein n=1 Tax=Rhodovulum sulfidophilum TaxID=35806 RepID=A0A2W5MYK2_RHOSU|nr:MAG: glutathione S-transferase family protein [Rhodovulum sulfidophilum]
MPLLHWSPRSPYVRKVMVALREKGLAGEVETVRTYADPVVPPGDFLAVNPLGKIPTLELDNGTVLHDSRVILEWADLTGKTGPRLFPADPAARLETLRDEALGTGMIDIGINLLIELFLRSEDQRHDRMLAAHRRKFVAGLDHLESRIAAIAARPFDAGHVSIGVALCYYDFRFADQDWRAGRPDLARWHAGFAARDSVAATGFRDDPRPD